MIQLHSQLKKTKNFILFYSFIHFLEPARSLMFSYNKNFSNSAGISSLSISLRSMNSLTLLRHMFTKRSMINGASYTSKCPFLVPTMILRGSNENAQLMPSLCVPSAIGFGDLLHNDQILSFLKLKLVIKFFLHKLNI